MSEPTISLRDVKERPRWLKTGGNDWIAVSIPERDALVEAVEAAHAKSIEKGRCLICNGIFWFKGGFDHAEGCPLARFSFDTEKRT